jgi:lipoate-protein ligase A
LQSPHLSINNWKVLPLTFADQQQHIEQSEQMLAAVIQGDAPTQYWSIAQPSGLVLGYSQKHELLNPTALTALKLPIYHRRAGGTAVLVGPHLLSLDVALPADSPLVLSDIVESYRWLGEAWVAALAQLNIQAHAVTVQEAREQRALLKQSETRERESLLRRACYGALSPYEVVVDQRKVVGLDMIRRRAGSLLQAGILLHWETEQLAQSLGHTPGEQAILREGLHERAVGIDTLVGRSVTAKEVIRVFEQTLFSRESAGETPITITGKGGV